MAILSRGEGADYRWEISDRELTLIISSLVDSLSRNSPDEVRYFFGWEPSEIQQFADDTNRQVDEVTQADD